MTQCSIIFPSREPLSWVRKKSARLHGKISGPPADAAYTAHALYRIRRVHARLSSIVIPPSGNGHVNSS
jgi:hypothetical protein